MRQCKFFDMNEQRKDLGLLDLLVVCWNFLIKIFLIFVDVAAWCLRMLWQKKWVMLLCTTVATFLKILQNKGFVKAEKMQGRQQRFIPLVTKDEYTSRVLGEVKDDFFDGSGMSFVKFFMKKERMTADQLKELIELVEKGE